MIFKNYTNKFASLGMLCLANIFSSEAQNLVLNPDMDPKSGAEINGFGQISKAENWSTASAGTVDYFSSSATNSELKTPSNRQGNQSPAQGDRYAGIIAYENNIYSEYVQVKLSQKLEKGVSYVVSFKASLSEKSAKAVKGLGALLTSSKNWYFHSDYMNKMPSIQSMNFVSDVNSWTEISGTYIAQGGEEFVTIGFFVPKSQQDSTAKLYVQDVAAGDSYQRSYYYIDDVIVKGGTASPMPMPQAPVAKPVAISPKDRDGDGVLDSKDACPDVAGVAKFKGCPDSDNDGIEDSKDACPTVNGIDKFVGCPDTDGDGIQDSKDACPTIPGEEKFEGCIDSDKDGIADNLDKCPYVAGLESLKGCPDGDADGVADGDDVCPTIKGLAENKGCPAVDEKTKQALKKALSGVQFETGKDVIKPTSFPILDNVVSILKEHQEYKLDIAGHTDNAGDRKKNTLLSEKRAAAAKNYLIKKGIQANRLRSEGYGPDKPIADNKTPAGKAKNRRVEFTVEF